MPADHPLDETDLRLLRRFVDEQISPFRKTGIALVAAAPLALVVALLEWHDRGFAEPPTDTTWLAGGAFAALALIGLAVWRRHRTPERTPMFRVLVTERRHVTRVEVHRVANNEHDRIVVHSPLAKEPLRLLVSHRDREAVAALLLRAYPGARGGGGGS